IIERLNTETDPVHTVSMKQIEFCHREFIRVRLETELFRYCESAAYFNEQPFKLRFTQRCRGAAADKNCAKRHWFNLFDLFDQCVHICVHRLVVDQHFVEITISTDPVAERDMDIHALCHQIHSYQKEKPLIQWLLLFIHFKNSEECFLWYFHIPDRLHFFLTFFLLLKQFAFTAYVPSVTFGKDVLTHGFDVGTGDDLLSDGSLYGHFELLSRNQCLELFHNKLATLIGKVTVDYGAQRIHLLVVQQDIQFGEPAFLVAAQFVVGGCISLRICFQLIEEIKYNLRQRDFIYDVDADVVQVIHGDKVAAFSLAQFHDRTDIVARNHDRRFHIRLFDAVHLLRIRHL